MSEGALKGQTALWGSQRPDSTMGSGAEVCCSHPLFTWSWQIDVSYIHCGVLGVGFLWLTILPWYSGHIHNHLIDRPSLWSVVLAPAGSSWGEGRGFPGSTWLGAMERKRFGKDTVVFQLAGFYQLVREVLGLWRQQYFQGHATVYVWVCHWDYEPT